MSIDEINLESISEQQVLNYLHNNPDFFIKHPDFTGQLNIPHQSGSAISLIEHQMNLLRQRNTEFHHRLEQLLTLAKENDQKFAHTRKLVLAVMQAQSLAELSRVVLSSLKNDFGVQHAELIFFLDPSLPDIRTENILEANRHIGKIITHHRAICGQFNEREHLWLFKDYSVRSAAVVPLQQLQVLGILAIGNNDPDYYNTGMGTLFLNYVAEVLNIAIPKLIP